MPNAKSTARTPKRSSQANPQTPAGAWFLLAALSSALLAGAGAIVPLLPDHPLAQFPAQIFYLALGRAGLPAMLILLVLSLVAAFAIALQRPIVSPLQTSLALALIVILAAFESLLSLAGGGDLEAGGLVGSALGTALAAVLPAGLGVALCALAAIGLASWALIASDWAQSHLGWAGARGIAGSRAAGRQIDAMATWLNQRFDPDAEGPPAAQMEAAIAVVDPAADADPELPAMAEESPEPGLVIKQPALVHGLAMASRGVPIPLTGQSGWVLPRPDIFEVPGRRERVSHTEITENATIIEETLANFRVDVRVVEAIPGPVVTQYCIAPSAGVRVTHITRHSDDLALALSARRIRIESPIPGRPFVGLEIPNRDPSVVTIRELLESREFVEDRTALKIALGKDVADHSQVRSLARMPHLLIAGSTGSGKSVFLNTVLISLLCQYTPDELKLVLIDPKMVELVPYNAVPHLLMPVVSTPAEAVPVLSWVQQEMSRRYRVLRDSGRRNVASFNADPNLEQGSKLPYLVVVVDEMADLMMTAPAEIELSICRLAQMARAVGIHLVIATQRPSVDVITGLIKANFPSRVAFSVSSQVDSRTILDHAGAEKLMGRGDMLFNSAEHGKSVRVQGAFASDDDITELVAFWVKQGEGEYVSADEIASAVPLSSPIDESELYQEAVSVVMQFNYASPALLQRELKLGAGKATDLIGKLAAAGIVGPQEGESSSRAVIAKSNPTDLVVAGSPQVDSDA